MTEYNPTYTEAAGDADAATEGADRIARTRPGSKVAVTAQKTAARIHLRAARLAPDATTMDSHLEAAARHNEDADAIAART